MIIAGIREVWYILLCKVVKTRLRPMTIYKKMKRYTDYNSINLYGTYDFSLGNHQFKIMAGFNQESSYQETMEAYPMDKLLLRCLHWVRVHLH